MGYKCTLHALTVTPGLRLYRCRSDICMHNHCPNINFLLIKLIFWLYNVHVGPAELATCMANLQNGTEKKNDESGASSTGEQSIVH